MIDLEKKELLEVIRLAYLSGIDDKENECDRWCPQGSKERAEELFYEFISDGEIAFLLNDK